MKKRNPIKRAMEVDRRWGDIHRDRTKYHRGGPNHHEWDSEIEEALDAENRNPDRSGEGE